jgi:hypothetical protein
MHQSRLVVTFLVLVVWTSSGTGRLGAQNINGSQPVPQTFNITEPAGAACAFTINISAQGLMKTINLPGGRMILTSPGLQAKVANAADLSKSVSLNVTGASHVTSEPNGSTVIVFSGRNLNFDPVAGFVLAIGNFRITLDAVSNVIEPLNGKGKLIDICALIE